MSESKDQLTLSGYIEDLNKEGGQENNSALVKEDAQQRRKLDKQRWYTVRPGIEFRTGPLGGDASVFLGRTDKPTKIRRIGKGVSKHNGISSISAVIEVDGELREAWFVLKDVRGATKGKK